MLSRLPSTEVAFAGFASPTFTQVPDELFDVLLPSLSDAELRVLLYIVRRTFGFKRQADTISLSQMVSGITTADGRQLDQGTGLSKATVARGLKSLREKGIIDATRNRSVTRGDEPTTYRLRFRDEHSSTATGRSSLSQPRDAPPVSPTGHRVSQPRDTQETGFRNTAFEYSRGNDVVDGTDVEEGSERQHTGSDQVLTDSRSEAGSVGAILSHRVRRDVGRDDRLAIVATVERFAGELGDQADLKLSVSRALNLFQAASVSRDTFLDVLFRARGETLDRRKFPGKAPVPRNLMAYFFAVTEDRLGLKQFSA